MSLREAKALACSPQNTWVFNTSRVLSKNTSEHCPVSLFLRLGDVSSDAVEPVSTYAGSGHNLISSGAFLKAASRISSFDPIQVNTGAQVAVELDKSLNFTF